MNDTIKTVTRDNPRYAAYARAHGRTPASVRYESHGKANARPHAEAVADSVRADVGG